MKPLIVNEIDISKACQELMKNSCIKSVDAYFIFAYLIDIYRLSFYPHYKAKDKIFVSYFVPIFDVKYNIVDIHWIHPIKLRGLDDSIKLDESRYKVSLPCIFRNKEQHEFLDSLSIEFKNKNHLSKHFDRNDTRIQYMKSFLHDFAKFVYLNYMDYDSCQL